MCPVAPPPFSAIEPVIDVLHGIAITDPYRWLEDQNSPETRAWIAAQTVYARSYLDTIPGRDRIRERVRELLDVEAYDSFLKSGTRYFFRKRLPRREQASIYFREGLDGSDDLLVDPAARQTGDYTAVKPLYVSRDGNLLLYEIKQGGERTGIFEILDVAHRLVFRDSLPHGFLRGFAFAPDGSGFFYVHEATRTSRPFYRAAYYHAFGTDFRADRQIFVAGEDRQLRLVILSGPQKLAVLAYRFLDKTYTDFHLLDMSGVQEPLCVLRNAAFQFSPRFLGSRIIAAINLDAPNRRIVEVRPRPSDDPLYVDLIPEADVPIRDWTVTANFIVVSYSCESRTQLAIFSLYGQRVGEIPCSDTETIRILAGGPEDDEILLERQSFTYPTAVDRISIPNASRASFAQSSVPFDSDSYIHSKLSFPSKDGTRIPMFLFGHREATGVGPRPLVMTAYGAHGVASTPQFSVLVAFLVERNCLFALPGIRGGSEYGEQWHRLAKRHNRQKAYDDFLAAAEWLVQTQRTTCEQLGIFGGSNSGLLVAAAMTQRPDLFRAVLCLVPLLDMLRYHLFDTAYLSKDEFGTAADPLDFAALWNYSPYHAVRKGTAYPATMLVTGDADGNCNPLHARKMTALLQAANSSSNPILLDYNHYRGHSPALPLHQRIEALADRLAFLCHQLEVSV
jgi:prolyl oligopeptidase